MHALKIIALLSSLHTMNTRHEVTRDRANHYAIGHVVAVTDDCTVTTTNLTARLDDGRTDGKPWIYFYDAAGVREADCSVRAIVLVTE